MGGFIEVVNPSALFAFSVFIVLCAYFLVNKGKYKLPPGPRGLPILGYLPFLGDDASLGLQKLSKKYGDIFGLYLGTKYVVVVADAVKAKELLCKHSTSDRPKDIFMLLPGGEGFVEESGEKWIEQRRYTIKELKNLGFGRSNWEKLVGEEVEDFLDILKKSQGRPVDIFSELSAGISNNVLSLLSGQRLPVGHPKREIIDQGIESFQLMYDQSGLVSSAPRLFKFCAEWGLIKERQKLKDIRNMSRCIREEILNLEHDKDGVSYIHKYFSEIEKNKQSNLRSSFNVGMLIGNIQALIIAGSDTTKVSLLWLFLAMAAYPHIQKKVQEEVDAAIGKDENVAWTDRSKLPYCIATIMEGQRWRTVLPLNLMHRTNEDIFVSGYVIPKGTNIITLIAAYHNDTKYWKDPHSFQPERFMTEEGKRLKEPDGYMPFSHGKRVCPGKTVALIEIFLYFVAVMQKFRILPASESTRPDLVGMSGLTLQPKRQLLRYVLR